MEIRFSLRGGGRHLKTWILNAWEENDKEIMISYQKKKRIEKREGKNNKVTKIC